MTNEGEVVDVAVFSNRMALSASSKDGIKHLVGSDGGLFVWQNNDFTRGVLGDIGEGVFVAHATDTAKFRTPTALTKAEINERPGHWSEITKFEGMNGTYDSLASDGVPLTGDFLIDIEIMQTKANIIVGVGPQRDSHNDVSMGVGFAVGGALYAGAGSGQTLNLLYANRGVFRLQRTGNVTRLIDRRTETVIQTFPVYAINSGPLYLMVANAGADGTRVRVRAIDQSQGAPGGKGAFVRLQGAEPLQARMFGLDEAKDAVGNTRALQAISSYINTMGGGTVVFEAGTYDVGVQKLVASEEWNHEPEDLLIIRGCTRDVSLIGNGALFNVTPGYYGSFLPGTTTRYDPPEMPFYDASYRSSPARDVIWVDDNSAAISVSGFSINGNIDKCDYGGRWADRERQITFNALNLHHNSGPQEVSDCVLHHCGLDGLALHTHVLSESQPPVPVKVMRTSMTFNGRQACSLTGGNSVYFEQCLFADTGRPDNRVDHAEVSSGPGAGIDIEAENSSIIRNVHLHLCTFDNNWGAGVLSDSGNAKYIKLTKCHIVGTDTYALWIHNPDFVLEECTVVGSAIFGWDPISDFANRRGHATRTIRTLFTDNPEFSSTGLVFHADTLAVNCTHGQVFDDCDFYYRFGMRMPNCPPSTRFRDCRLNGEVGSQTEGIFEGINEVVGPANLTSSQLLGTMIRNGVRQDNHPSIAVAAGGPYVPVGIGFENQSEVSPTEGLGHRIITKTGGESNKLDGIARSKTEVGVGNKVRFRMRQDNATGYVAFGAHSAGSNIADYEWRIGVDGTIVSCNSYQKGDKVEGHGLADSSQLRVWITPADAGWQVHTGTTDNFTDASLFFTFSDSTIDSTSIYCKVLLLTPGTSAEIRVI